MKVVNDWALDFVSNLSKLLFNQAFALLNFDCNKNAIIAINAIITIIQ